MKIASLGIGWGLTLATFLVLGPGVARAEVIDVHVTNNVFTPDFVVINLGDTVRWIFDEGVHTTTSDDGEWDSGVVQPGTMFEHTFLGTGQYDYQCTLHVDCCNMVGSIYVQDFFNPIIGVQPVNSLGLSPP